MPQFNEAHTVLSVLADACRYVDLAIVVDDGSTDASAALVAAWMREDPKVVLISLGENQGMSGALLAGFCYVQVLLDAGTLGKDDVVVNIDADGQHRPAEIPTALAAMDRSGCDILLGRRDLSGYPPLKQWGNRVLSWIASVLSGVGYHDVECGFRLLKVGVVPDLLRYFTGRRYGCAQEIGVITAMCGHRIANDFPTGINYYRPGARIVDGVTNLRMALTAYLRVRLGRENDVAGLVARVLERAAIKGNSATGGGRGAP